MSVPVFPGGCAMSRGLLSRGGVVCVLGSALWGAMPMRAQTPSALNVMPLPAKVQVGGGVLKIDTGFSMAFSGDREARLDRAAQRFVVQLERETGMTFPAATAAKDASKATLLVTTDHESKPVQELGEDERVSLAPVGQPGFSG